MAIGLALLFNIRLPINFNSPYKARNIQDFWKRWHMTLGRFLTQYIYIPLGGSKHGEWLTYLNTLIVFFISGFWHGAGWTFIIWGLMHGVGVVAVRVWKLTKIRLPYVVAWLLTFQFVNIGWVFFRSASVEQAFTILGKMFTPDWASVPKYFKQAVPYLNEAATLELFIGTMDNPYIIVASLVFLFAIALSMRNSLERLDRFAFNWRSIFFIQVLVLLVLTSVFFMQKNSVFLYFNF
jgi:alginate O-acetyltransferase complex protein AlgI